MDVSTSKLKITEALMHFREEEDKEIEKEHARPATGMSAGRPGACEAAWMTVQRWLCAGMVHCAWLGLAKCLL